MKNLFSPEKKIIGFKFNAGDPTPAGNAFVVMGTFTKMCRASGWSEEEIDIVLKEAMSSNYENLIDTINAHIDDED